MDSHRLIHWHRMGLEGQHGEDPTYGNTKLKEAGDNITLGTGSIEIGNGKHASAFKLPKLWNILQGPDCDDKGSTSMAKLFNGAGSHSNHYDVLFGFQDHLRAKNA